MQFLRKIYYKFFIKPKKLEQESDLHYAYRKDVLKYYWVYHPHKITQEEKDALKYLQNNQLHYFTDDFYRSYLNEEVKVFYDPETSLRFVFHEGKRLYFKRSWSEERIQKSYIFLRIEQDPQSPHCYLNQNFTINKNDIVVDIGSAEGNFSLNAIEKAKKIIIIEADKDWIEPLNATFKPWKEKVTILNKYVSNESNEKTSKLDKLVNKRVSFIKIDAEGEEYNILKGASQILSGNSLKLVICTYHNPEDAYNVGYLLVSKKFKIEHSKGLMLFLDRWKSPYLRKALVRAYKND